jgi:hypothetical protein
MWKHRTPFMGASAICDFPRENGETETRGFSH